MKRCRFGAVLLMVLLILGAVSAWAMIRGNRPVSEQIKQAGEAAFLGDWTSAEEQFRQAKVRWENQFPFCAALADHEPMENINGLFAQLEIYARIRDAEGFAAACALLSEDVEAIGEAHRLNWWNLL